MLSLKIQCEHSPDGTSYNWFTIAEWLSAVHSTRQLISLCERYHRIRDILARIPEQSQASGNCVGKVLDARGVDMRAKHSCYAGVTGVRLLSGNEVIGLWCIRDKPKDAPTPDVAVMSNRQIAALGGAALEAFAAAAMTDEAVSTMAKEGVGLQAEGPLELQPTERTPKPKRVIQDAPKPAPSYSARPPKAPKTQRSKSNDH